jgi:cellulose synthase/poly-beta-1,6-N-acetylglucosamine synthase-like glycosyltransferase
MAQLHTLEIIVLASSALYVLGLMAFLPGLFRGLRRKKEFPFPVLPPVTVLICARNEEHNLDYCLSSLAKIDYPPELLEILIVDDRSSDSTPQMLTAWKNLLPHLKIITIYESDETQFQGKINALIHGIDAAVGEFIVITDADCSVKPDWVREHLRWYETDTGMVSSITVLDSMKPFDGAQSLEMVQLLGLSMSAINSGIPVSIIGNNLSIRKSAYEEIGGYRNIPFSVTEDVALFQKMWDAHKWKVRFKANEDLLVKSQAPKTFNIWWRQKHRWVIGGKEIGLEGRLILVLGFIGAFVFITSLSTLGQHPYAFAALGIKFLADLVIIFPVLRGLKQMKLLIFFAYYQLYLFCFLLCVPVLYLQKDVRWKGRIYHT